MTGEPTPQITDHCPSAYTVLQLGLPPRPHLTPPQRQDSFSITFHVQSSIRLRKASSPGMHKHEIDQELVSITEWKWSMTNVDILVSWEWESGSSYWPPWPLSPWYLESAAAWGCQLGPWCRSRFEWRWTTWWPRWAAWCRAGSSACARTRWRSNSLWEQWHNHTSVNPGDEGDIPVPESQKSSTHVISTWVPYYWVQQLLADFFHMPCPALDTQSHVEFTVERERQTIKMISPESNI